jgi:hypothetical protein
MIDNSSTPRKRMDTYYSTGQAARLLGLPRWKLIYLIDRGDLPEPSVELPGRRVYTPADIDALREALERRRGQDAEWPPRGRGQ